MTTLLRRWLVSARTAGLLAAGLLALAATLQAGAPSTLPDLPIAISNNAVAALSSPDGFSLYSFFGLEPGKTWRDVSRKAYAFDSGSGTWRELPTPPVSQGRLASVAATAGGRVYLFGGYTVTEDGAEISTAEVLRFDPGNDRYQAMAAMPVPVDDSVALVWRDRWIILVSGWHDRANVADVQVFDTRHNRWQASTPWPGAPVFGHAGALSGDTLLVCDGVRLDVSEAGKRQFSASKQCWQGHVHGKKTIGITWQPIAAHPGRPRYRMAAGSPGNGQLLFVGGSENPYNYNGIGYDTLPSAASSQIDRFDLASGQWRAGATLSSASMDHRGLPCVADRCFLLGGMRAKQTSTAAVQELPR